MSPMTQESSIAAELRDDILRGHYRCGERLPSERDLADRFGVHRSTVRAAIKRLEQLGVAHVRPGGARVGAIEEASLEILDPLLALHDPPDAVLLDQTLEAMSGFLAHAARLGSERASEDERARMLSILDEMIETKPASERRGELFAALGAAFVEATGNRVLALLRHGLRTRYSDYVLPDSRRGGIAAEALEPHLRALRTAIEQGAGASASEAVYAVTARIRDHIRCSLEGESVRATQDGGLR